MATHVYVDGFNLYYGSVKGTQYKWLDVAALCKTLLPNDSIDLIRYFTARVNARNDPITPQRQDVYLRALATTPNLTIHYGHYLTHAIAMRLERPPAVGSPYVRVMKTEEKGSDVNLASFLLLDAAKGKCDVAVLITNDSDLKVPIEIAQQEFGLTVGVINPHPPNRRSRALRPTFFKQIREGALRSCQFSDQLADSKGQISKPAAW